MELKRRIFEEEHIIFRESVKRWVDDVMRPRKEEFYENRIVPKDIWLDAGSQGYLCMWADEKYGGAGIDDFRFDQILTEEITKCDAGFYAPLHNRIVAPYINKFGTEEQKQHFLPSVISGENILAICMTEPGAGSDVAGIRTFAEDKGDHWELNGSKTFISNGINAGLYLVAAKTSRENPYSIGLFLVEEDREGFTRGQKLKKLGLHTQDTAELFFDTVKVPKFNVLGDPTQGFKNMMVGLAEERLIGAIGYVARSERAFDITLNYIKEREAFGRPVGTFQNSRFKMAGMKAEIDAAYAFVDHCVMEHLEGNLTGEMGAEIKLYTSEVEARVVDECLQLHGGAGFMEEYEISRLYADARVSRIYAGSSEIMKEIIGRGLGLDDRHNKRKS